jgi:hypothetical protein
MIDPTVQLPQVEGSEGPIAGSPAAVNVRHPLPVPDRTAFRFLGYLVLIHFKNKQSNGRR